MIKKGYDKKVYFLLIIKCLVIGVLLGGMMEVMISTISYFRFGKDKGIQEISCEKIRQEGLEKQGEYYIVGKSGGKIEINTEGERIGKFQYGYESSAFSNAIVTMWDENGNGEEIKDTYIPNVSRSVVNRYKKTSKIEIVFPENENQVILKEFIIDNQFKINLMRMALIILGVFLFILLLAMKHELNDHIHVYVFVALLSIGVYMAVLQPPFCASWDEHIHFRTCYELAATEKEDPLPVAVQNLWGYVQQMYSPYITIEEKYDMMRMENSLSKIDGTEKDSYELKLNSIGYLPEVLGMKIGTALKLPFSIVWILARMFSVFFYATIMSFAIKILPTGKLLMTIVSMLPTAVFLSSSFTYDTFVTCFITLYISIVVKESVTENTISIKNQILLIVIGVLGCLPKAVYAPLILIPLMWKKEKFETRKQQTVFRIAMISTFLLLMSTFVLPVLLAPKVTGDLRGGNTSNSGQMAFIFGHPIRYTKILLSNIGQTFVEYTLGSTTLNFFAYLGKGEAILYALLVGGVVLTEKEKCKNVKSSFSIREKIYCGIFIFITICLIWTALYIDFTEVGKTQIMGVQGRYYLPFLFLLYFMFKTDKVKIKINEIRYKIFVLIMAIGLLLANVVKFMLIPLGM